MNNSIKQEQNELVRSAERENHGAMLNNIKVFLNGLIKENPTFVLLLGMCPTLGTTSSAFNGMSMGLATMAVLVFSNFII